MLKNAQKSEPILFTVFLSWSTFSICLGLFRLLQRKRRGANDQQQNRVSGMSGVTSVASSVTNLESIASSHEQEQQNKMVRVFFTETLFISMIKISLLQS